MARDELPFASLMVEISGFRFRTWPDSVALSVNAFVKATIVDLAYFLETKVVEALSIQVL